MKVIAQFVVRLFDLIEAEGSTLLTVVRGEARRARASAANLLLGMSFLLIAVPLTVAGVGLITVGLMWWLEAEVGRPLAAVLTGAAVLVAAGVCLMCFRAVVAMVQL